MARTKIPQLYIKNGEGKFEKYRLPENDISETVYRKINGKFIPIGKEWERDHLTDGIWVVTSSPGCKSITSGKYIKDLFSVDRISDIGKLPSMDDLAAWYRSAEDICKSEAVQGMWTRSHSLIDVVTTVMGEIFKEVRLKDKPKAGDVKFTPSNISLTNMKYIVHEGEKYLIKTLEGDIVGFHIVSNTGGDENEWLVDKKPLSLYDDYSIKVVGYVRLA